MDTRAATLDVSREGGVDISDADAAVGDVKDPKTFYSVTAPKKTGTMVTRTLNPANENVLAGYYAATTLSAVDGDLVTGNIKSGETIFGVAGSTDVRDSTDADAAVGDVKSPKTFYAGGGARKTGTMPTKTLSPANDTVQAGYYAATTLHAVDADLAAGNIKSGKTIFGFAGTAKPTKYDLDDSPARGTNSLDVPAYVTSVDIAAGSDSAVVQYDSSSTNSGDSVLVGGCVMARDYDACGELKLRLYIDGVQVDEDTAAVAAYYFPDSVRGHKDNCSAGTVLAELKYHNYDTETRELRYIGSYVVIGSVTL